MIDFTSKQLSYIVLSLAGIGGGGYMTMNSKVDEIDKKLAVSIASTENNIRSMEKIERQLIRIEDKLDSVKRR
jgi:hypothetical protein